MVPGDPQVDHGGFLGRQHALGNQALVPPLLPVGEHLEDRCVVAVGGGQVGVDEILTLREALRDQRPGHARPGVVPGRQDRCIADSLGLQFAGDLRHLVPGLRIVAGIVGRLEPPRLQMLEVEEGAERPAVVVGEAEIVAVVGHRVLIEPWNHLAANLIEARHVVDRPDPAGRVPARRLAALGVEHVEGRARGKLGLQHRGVVAGDRLEIDLLVLLGHEEVGVRGHDLAAPGPEREDQRVQVLCQRGHATHRTGGGDARRAHRRPFQEAPPAHARKLTVSARIDLDAHVTPPIPV